MAKRSLQDLYPNRAFNTLTLSAANTLTFSQIQFGVGLFQGVAMIIHRVEWEPQQADLIGIQANTDFIAIALTNRDDLTGLDPTNQSVLVRSSVIGTGAMVEPFHMPIVHDFNDMPGGGLIVPANPIYVGMETGGLAAAGVVRTTLFCTFKELSDAEYVELVQTIMPANI